MDPPFERHLVAVVTRGDAALEVSATWDQETFGAASSSTAIPARWQIHAQRINPRSEYTTVPGRCLSGSSRTRRLSSRKRRSAPPITRRRAALKRRASPLDDATDPQGSQRQAGQAPRATTRPPTARGERPVLDKLRNGSHRPKWLGQARQVKEVVRSAPDGSQPCRLIALDERIAERRAHPPLADRALKPKRVRHAITPLSSM